MSSRLFVRALWALAWSLAACPLQVAAQSPPELQGVPPANLGTVTQEHPAVLGPPPAIAPPVAVVPIGTDPAAPVESRRATFDDDASSLGPWASGLLGLLAAAAAVTALVISVRELRRERRERRMTQRRRLRRPRHGTGATEPSDARERTGG